MKIREVSLRSNGFELCTLIFEELDAVEILEILATPQKPWLVSKPGHQGQRAVTYLTEAGPFLAAAERKTLRLLL